MELGKYSHNQQVSEEIMKLSDEKLL